MTDDFPLAATGKPLWLVTLADLALLLVGFLVLVQATRHEARGSLAAGLRERFGGEAAGADPAAMPVAAAGISDFAPGSAALPPSAAAATAGLVEWARTSARDPRVTLTVTGHADGSAADHDPASGSAAILAADRARAVAVLLAPAVPAGRLIVTTTTRPGRRAALVTLAFTGDRR